MGDDLKTIADKVLEKYGFDSADFVDEDARRTVEEMRARPKCEHVYNPVNLNNGTTPKGTLILDEYKDPSLNRLNQYRCVKCDRIMRRSKRGRMYYLRCEVELEDGSLCGKHATFISYDTTQHRRVFVGQSAYAYCKEHAAPEPVEKPKTKPRTILRKRKP